MATSQAGAENGECSYPKVINDPVHGFIELPPLCMKIIDTPQFQRLRDIKQLSFCSYVYPGATHSRFEHSLGTCFLAGQQVKHLQKQKPPQLGITERDVLCVEIAALCHDLGHGPFSHLWESFMKSTMPAEANAPKWSHEDFSVKMLKFLINENDLEESFRDGFGDHHVVLYKKFIELQINGTAEERLNYPWKLSDAEEDRSFLYEIVSNKATGLDVDKWDYISRDCHHLGFQHNFCHDRILKFSRVCTDENGKKHISIPEKELLNLYSMFNSRFILHSRVYQHNVALAIDCMFEDAFKSANDIMKRGGENLHQASHDVKLLSKMTDSIFQEILYSDKEGLKKARETLERIHTRDLYKFVDELTEHISFEDVQEYCKNEPRLGDRIVCRKKTVGFGKNGENPLFQTYFYKKSKLDTAFKLTRMSHLLPVSTDCNEAFVVFFCRNAADFDDVKMRIIEKYRNDRNIS